MRNLLATLVVVTVRTALCGICGKSERKQNGQSLYSIIFGIQAKGVTGKADDMRAHLTKCQHASHVFSLASDFKSDTTHTICCVMTVLGYVMLNTMFGC